MIEEIARSLEMLENGSLNSLNFGIYRTKRMFEKYRFWPSPAPRLKVGANGTKSFEKDWKLDVDSLLVP